MNNRLFVAGLSFNTTSEELRTLFTGFGNVLSAVVITDRDTGRSKGFGFVEMETNEMAQASITKLNGSEYGGRKLIVNIAKPREDSPRNNRNFQGRPGGFSGQKRSFSRHEGGRGNFGRNRADRSGFRSGRR